MADSREMLEAYNRTPWPADIGDRVGGVVLAELDDEIQDVTGSDRGLRTEVGASRVARLGLALAAVPRLLPAIEPVATRAYFARAMPARSFRPGVAVLAAAAAVLAVGGCAHGGPGASGLADAVRAPDCDGPPRPVPAAARAALPPHDEATYAGDAFWLALADRVPGGFGGAFATRRYRVLWLTDPAEARAAKAALAPALDPGGFRTARAHVWRARWTFAELADWGAYVGVLGGIPGLRPGDVRTSDRDERTNRIALGVPDRAARDRVAAGLAALGVPCDLAVVGVAQPVVPAGR